MLFSETLEQLKNNLPSQYRDNIIDYKTLKNGIHEVVESLNKTGLYDMQCHSHLIMENDMKTNIDKHIREMFKKSKVVVNKNTLLEIFDDEEIISPKFDNDHKSYEKFEKVQIIDNNNNNNSKENENNNLSSLKDKEILQPKDTTSIASIYEMDINYNYKVDLEEELKKSQVKLVKFINQAKNKEEIIKGLSLKYCQIFYALNEIEKEDGSKQLKSKLIVSINKVNPKEFDVKKLLDEITGQNSELFEHNDENEEKDNDSDNKTNTNNNNADNNTNDNDESNKIISPDTDENDDIKEEKIDNEHLQQLMESLKDEKPSSPIEDLDKIITNGTPLGASMLGSCEDTTKPSLNSPDGIEIVRLIKSPTDFKIDEHMLGRVQNSDSTDLKNKRKDSFCSQNSSNFLDSDQDQDQDQEYEFDEIFEFPNDDEVKIVLPKSTSQNSIPKEKEIELDPIAVMGDSEEMIRKRASIIQKRLSEYNSDEGISKEKFISLFNNKKHLVSQKSSDSNINERKVSFSSSVSSSFHHSSYASSMKSSIAELEVQNYWEIPIYSYYTFSFVTEDELNEISSEIPNTQEPETIEILETNETGIHGKNSRQSSYSSINTAKNSPEVKILKMLDTQEHKLMKNGNGNDNKNENENVNENAVKATTTHESVHFSMNNIINNYSQSQDSSNSTLNYFTEPQPIIKEKRRTSLSNLFKKSKSQNETFKTYDQLFIEERQKKVKGINKANSTSNALEEHFKDNALYVRKTKSHSFSYHFKNPFKRLSSKKSLRKQSTVSFSPADQLNEYESVTPDHLRELEQLHCTNQNKEKRIEIGLESDSAFLNKMVSIFKNLTLFEKDCKNLFHSNITATKNMLKEVSTPGKVDTYPWRSVNRLYKEVDVWTYNGKVSTWKQATDKLELFKIKAESFTKKFKMEESPIVFEQFLKLNRDVITLKQFYEINQTAIYMVLREHDKDTKLSACEGLPGFVSTEFFSDNVLKRLTYELTQDLLNIIPDPEKYSCPICRELAYKPIRLDCGHLFCLKCLIKAQKKNLDNCPVCRAQDAVKNATSKNLDKKLLKVLTTEYPREIKARKKQIKEINHQQEIEDAKEYDAQPASLKNNDEEACCIM